MVGQNSKVKVGLSMMLEDDFRQATASLFANNQVDVIEWSFDTCWQKGLMPGWAQDLLEYYSKQDLLLGHGVYFSALSTYSPLHKDWLAKLSNEIRTRKYIHISEHFGFSQAGHVLRGAPLPVPYCAEAVTLGKENLRRLSDIVNLPVGLENLALAFCKEDVLNQGIFLKELLQEINGFILLDLHNLYCQIQNFSLNPETLLQTYPLADVKELHISGGSLNTLGNDRTIRRDTHDGDAPEAVFTLLETVLDLCPNIDYIILERLGGTLNNQTDMANFQDEFMRIKNIVENH